MKNLLQSLKRILKKKISAFLLILVLVILVIYYVQKDKPTPPPTPAPTPTSFSENLNLVKIFPSGDTVETVFNATAIIFYFDSNLDITTAEATINPEIDIIYDISISDPSALAVRPVGNWEEDTKYTITVKSGLMSLDYKELNQDIVHEFTFKFPEDITVY